MFAQHFSGLDQVFL